MGAGQVLGWVGILGLRQLAWSLGLWRLLQLPFESVISSFDGSIGRRVMGYGKSAMCSERVAIVVLPRQRKSFLIRVTRNTRVGIVVSVSAFQARK